MSTHRSVEKLRSRLGVIHQAMDNLTVGDIKVLEKVGRKIELQLDQFIVGAQVSFKKKYGIDLDVKDNEIWKDFKNYVSLLSILDYVDNKLQNFDDFLSLYTDQYVEEDSNQTSL